MSKIDKKEFGMSLKKLPNLLHPHAIHTLPKELREKALLMFVRWGKKITQKQIDAQRAVFNEIKHIIFPLRGRKCFVCDDYAEHRHHIIPLGRGGKNKRVNLVALCRKCHSKVHKAYLAEMEEEKKKVAFKSPFTAGGKIDIKRPNGTSGKNSSKTLQKMPLFEAN